jgi:two-component system, cell cycle response regulator DivK
MLRGSRGAIRVIPVQPSSARILVVEDDPDNRIVISRLLLMAGVSAESVAAIEGDVGGFFALTGREFDLVFLDLQLPKKDGYAVLSELRSNPLLSSTRVVALTANVTKREVLRCREAGFNGFIGKPIDGRRFSELLQKILDGESVWMED